MREEGVLKNMDKGGAPRPGKPKKPYARPAIVYRQPLEALASVCTGDGSKAPAESCVLLYS